MSLTRDLIDDWEIFVHEPDTDLIDDGEIFVHEPDTDLIDVRRENVWY